MAALVAFGCTAQIDSPAGDSNNGGAPIRGAATPVPTPPPPPAPAATEPWDGHWYLDEGDRRVVLTLIGDGDRQQHGTIADETAATPAHDLADVTFDSTRRELTFRDQRAGGVFAYYRVHLRDGVATGRIALTTSPPAPTDATAFAKQVIGWRDETFSAAIVPRAFDLVIGGHRRATLRIDQSPFGGPLVGRFKLYATDNAVDEHLSEDVEVTAWDGHTLRFWRPAAPEHDQFTGTASGRSLNGTVVTDAGDAQSFTATRIEVLSHGLVTRSARATQDWQTRTRRRLAWLTMTGNPAPLSLKATSLGRYTPFPATAVSGHRDDAMGVWPASYELEELNLDSTLASPSGGAPIARRAHAILAVPTTPAPPGGYPVALALNGHWGSAWWTFDPQNWLYWYGDSFARRGFVVIAVDISHRPLADRQRLYADLTDGDDPGAGNGSHPAIKDPGLDSEWEEDGERTWDAMRGLDYVLARPDVNPQKVTVVGLSMGAEVSEWVGAMDGRPQTVIVASGPSDLAVMRYHGNHPCWGWLRGDVREFVDPGDLDALAAPRTFVRETGLVDGTFSSLPTPFVGDKQTVRRAQPVFDALGGRLVHYLHYDAHIFHVGEQPASPDLPTLGVTAPMVASALADQPWSTQWQTDQSTEEVSPSLYDELAQ